MTLRIRKCCCGLRFFRGETDEEVNHCEIACEISVAGRELFIRSRSRLSFAGALDSRGCRRVPARF
jgi:hypothetical protein